MRVAGLLSIAALLAWTSASAKPAAANGPEALLRNIYSKYEHGQFSMDNWLAFLAPDTKTLVAKARTTDAWDDAIDYDPVCDCQDRARLRLQAIKVVGSGPNQWRGVVSYTLGGHPDSTGFSLSKTASGWRIEDLLDGSAKQSRLREPLIRSMKAGTHPL